MRKTEDDNKSESESIQKNGISDSGHELELESHRPLIDRLLQKSGHFIEADSSIEPDYNEMAEYVREISGARYVAANIIDISDNGYYTRALSGIPGYVMLSTRIFGFNILNHKWKHPKSRVELSIHNTVIKNKNLKELVGRTLHDSVVKIIEKQFSIGEIVVLSIIREKELLGDFVLLFERGHTLQNEHLAGLYAHMVGQFLTRKRMEEMLKMRMDEMERFQKLSVDRELMMITLKKEVNDLLEQSGKDPKYNIVSDFLKT